MDFKEKPVKFVSGQTKVYSVSIQYLYNVKGVTFMKQGIATYLTFDLLVWGQEVPPFSVYCPLQCSIGSTSAYWCSFKGYIKAEQNKLHCGLNMSMLHVLHHSVWYTCTHCELSIFFSTVGNDQHTVIIYKPRIILCVQPHQNAPPYLFLHW